MRTMCVDLFRHQMILGRAAIAALLAFAFAVTTPSHAQFCGDVADYDTNCKDPDKSYHEGEWREAQTPMPPAPKNDDLRAIPADRADPRYEYLLDRTSIRRGSDDVMRYVVVVVSSSGVRNAFYEGIRCLTDEVKTYGYASKDGEFRRATGTRWGPLAVNGVRAYQEYLAGVIVCDRDGYAWDADKAVAALEGQYTAGGVRIEGFVCPDCDLADERRTD